MCSIFNNLSHKHRYNTQINYFFTQYFNVSMLLIVFSYTYQSHLYWRRPPTGAKLYLHHVSTVAQNGQRWLSTLVFLLLLFTYDHCYVNKYLVSQSNGIEDSYSGLAVSIPTTRCRTTYNSFSHLFLTSVLIQLIRGKIRTTIQIATLLFLLFYRHKHFPMLLYF